MAGHAATQHGRVGRESQVRKVVHVAIYTVRRAVQCWPTSIGVSGARIIATHTRARARRGDGRCRHAHGCTDTGGVYFDWRVTRRKLCTENNTTRVQRLYCDYNCAPNTHNT
jgi:hypothetical protein